MFREILSAIAVGCALLIMVIGANTDNTAQVLFGGFSLLFVALSDRKRS